MPEKKEEIYPPYPSVDNVDHYDYGYRKGYNQTLSDILKIIESL